MGWARDAVGQIEAYEAGRGVALKAERRHLRMDLFRIAAKKTFSEGEELLTWKDQTDLKIVGHGQMCPLDTL